MSKSYDISKKSDMNRLMRDIEQKAHSKAVDELHKRKYDVSCPKCKGEISIPPGLSLCPLCGNEIDLKLDIDFNG